MSLQEPFPGGHGWETSPFKWQAKSGRKGF